MTSYVKKTWIDESLAGDPEYNITDGYSGSVAFSGVGIHLSTHKAIAGTDVDADCMNNIETGVDDQYKYGLTYGTSSSPLSFSGSAQLLDTHRQLLFLDSGSAAGTAGFPSAGSANHIFALVNSGSAGAITMNDADATVINIGETRIFMPDDPSYRVVGETLYGITDDPAWVAKGNLAAGTGSGAAQILTAGSANGMRLAVDSSKDTGLTWIQDKSSFGFIIGTGFDEIQTGIVGDSPPIPYDCTITGVYLLADQSGSIVVDIWKDTYANFPPTDVDSITASAPPTITTATKSYDSTLTDWTTSLSQGDILRFNVDSCTDIQQVTLALIVNKTAVS
jgi:hypothetical protein